MDNTQLKTERTERRLERIVLIVLSLYTAASFATGLLSGWSIYIRELLFVPTVSGWFIYFREYWDHPRRAVFICISCWTEFILYALFTDSFSAMLVTMAGVIVLLSIFNTQQILYPGLVVPFFLFLYHGFIARTIAITGPRSALRLGIQFLSVYMVTGGKRTSDRKYPGTGNREAQQRRLSGQCISRNPHAHQRGLRHERSYFTGGSARRCAPGCD